MTAPRFVALGLAHARAEWFPEVARWSTSGHLPLEFVKCVSVEDLRARAASGRRFSAALVDGQVPAVDRDLIGALGDLGIPTLVIGTPAPRIDWRELGAATALDVPLTRDDLQAALERHATTVTDVLHDLGPGPQPRLDVRAPGRLVAVTGRAGSGRSTLAIAVAQHLATRAGSGDVVLVDLARRGHQALLHDAGDLVPGIQELTEACRSATVAGRDLRPFTFDIEHRGYHLVLGLRRPRDWVTIRSRAFATALDSIDQSFDLVVADVDDDLEGESQTGSFDIEDRNLMARATVRRADVVLVVAQATLTGLHGLVDSLQGLHEFGIDGDRILVALNHSPRSPRARSELARTVADLTRTDGGGPLYAGAVFVAERLHLDLVHHDRVRVPAAVSDPPGRAVEALLARTGSRRRAHDDEEPVPVQPGSLGTSPDLDR